MTQQEMNICLWFDNQAEEAAKFYTSIFPDSRMGQISRFGKEGYEFHGKPEGSVMTVDFQLNRMKFVALNGGPIFKFNEAISIMIYCETQDEINYYWSKLSDGGQESQCGWLKDRFGVSWQIVPSILSQYLSDSDITRKTRVERSLFKMNKPVISDLKKAYEG
jgi:predicted 3-demethylubiquinone-9 3-methyltransferase (glyoxalase superfamily)